MRYLQIVTLLALFGGLLLSTNHAFACETLTAAEYPGYVRDTLDDLGVIWADQNELWDEQIAHPYLMDDPSWQREVRASYTQTEDLLTRAEDIDAPEQFTKTHTKLVKMLKLNVQSDDIYETYWTSSDQADYDRSLALVDQVNNMYQDMLDQFAADGGSLRDQPSQSSVL